MIGTPGEMADLVTAIGIQCAQQTGRALQRDHLEILRRALGVSDGEMRLVNEQIEEAICEQIRAEYREEVR